MTFCVKQVKIWNFVKILISSYVVAVFVYVHNVYRCLKEVIPLCYKELNLFIVNLQYVFSQHNNNCCVDWTYIVSLQ